MPAGLGREKGRLFSTIRFREATGVGWGQEKQGGNMQRSLKHLVPSRGSPEKRAVGRDGLLHISLLLLRIWGASNQGLGVGGRA